MLSISGLSASMTSSIISHHFYNWQTG